MYRTCRRRIHLHTRNIRDNPIRRGDGRDGERQGYKEQRYGDHCQLIHREITRLGTLSPLEGFSNKIVTNSDSESEPPRQMSCLPTDRDDVYDECIVKGLDAG